MKWEIGRTLNVSQYGSGKENRSEDIFARGMFIRPNNKRTIKWEQRRNNANQQLYIDKIGWRTKQTKGYKYTRMS